jgi:hypothetical protein
LVTQHRFLLAELQVKQLMQSKSTRRLQNALKAISAGVSTYETAYEAAMDRIQSQDKRRCEIAKNAISLLAYAERPLLAPELVHALAVDLDVDEVFNPEPQKIGDLQSMCNKIGVYDPDLLLPIEDVLAASAGLIVYQPDSGIVQLVHKTTKEYLMSDDGRQKWFPRAQFTIAATCLTYSQAFEGCDDAATSPFLDYAQNYYGHHIMAQQSLERSKDPVAKASHESGQGTDPSFLQSQQLMDQIGAVRMAQELGQTGDVLITFCEKNQVNLARVLLSINQYSRHPKTSENVDAGSSYHRVSGKTMDRALAVAVRNGNLELVDLLLKSGANISTRVPIREIIPGLVSDIPKTKSINLLAVASCMGHQNIVTHILDHDHFTMAMMEHDDEG